jgi:hypothetical protein
MLISFKSSSHHCLENRKNTSVIHIFEGGLKCKKLKHKIFKFLSWNELDESWKKKRFWDKSWNENEKKKKKISRLADRNWDFADPTNKMSQSVRQANVENEKKG